MATKTLVLSINVNLSDNAAEDSSAQEFLVQIEDDEWVILTCLDREEDIRITFDMSELVQLMDFVTEKRTQMEFKKSTDLPF